MTLDNDKVYELFLAARDLPSAKREPFLDNKCGDDDTLRAEVESLLSQYIKPTSFPTIEAVTQSPESYPPTEHRFQSGDRIGNFEIIKTLGSGGFGTVYLAKQHEPVERDVALKVLHANRCTEKFIRGFEDERQILAEMNHPGIAHFYDAGFTQFNQPYFVMEYVDGDPITEYCDNKNLTIAQRLKLFAEVCKAVQHAHNKLVIHLDLTPNNILVSDDDEGNPRAKIIDFGISKSGDDSTVDVAGTLQYMSPEQATRGKRADAKSDIFTLGVVLYELLVGRPPLDAEMFQKAALHAQFKLVQEQEPPDPSTKLSGLHDAGLADSIASARQEKLESLIVKLRRELDWIPRKALQKDPERRYTTASAFASDIVRYLQGEAIEAAPDSTAYRMNKLFKRNKGKFIAAATILFVLVGGITFSLYFAFDAEQQRKDAVAEREIAIEQTRIAKEERSRAEAVKNVITKMLSSVNPITAGTMDKELMKLVLRNAAISIGEESELDPIVKADIHDMLGITYESLGLYQEAISNTQKSFEIRVSEFGENNLLTIKSMYDMSLVLLAMGKPNEAEKHILKVITFYRNNLGDIHPETLKSISILASILGYMGKAQESEVLYRKVLTGRKKVLGNIHEDTFRALGNVAVSLTSQFKDAEALPYSQEAMEGLRKVLGDLDPETLQAIMNYGVLLLLNDEWVEAQKYLEESTRGLQDVLGESHDLTQSSMIALNGLLNVRLAKARTPISENDAIEKIRMAVMKNRELLGNEHKVTIMSIALLSTVLYESGEYDEAEKYGLEAYANALSLFGEVNPLTANTLSSLGMVLTALGKFEEAEDSLGKAAEIGRFALSYSDDNPDLKLTGKRLQALYSSNGKSQIELLQRHYLEPNRRNLGEEHPETRNAMGLIGTMLLSKGEFKTAELHLTELFEICTRVLNDDDPETIESINQLINLYKAWGKPEEAQKYRDMLREEDAVTDDTSE